MKGVSKRLRKKGIQRSTPFTSGQGYKTNGFSNSAPLLPFSHGDYPPIASDAHAGPWTIQPGFACINIFARNYFQ